MRVVTLRGRVSFWIIVLGGVECCSFFFRDVMRILCIFSFLSFLDTLFLYMRSCDHLYTYIVLIFVLRGVLFLFEGCSEDAMYLFFSFFLRYIVLEHEVLWPFIDIHCFFHPLFHVLFLFSLYTYDSYYCMQSIIFVSHKDALMSFV